MQELEKKNLKPKKSKNLIKWLWCRMLLLLEADMSCPLAL